MKKIVFVMLTVMLALHSLSQEGITIRVDPLQTYGGKVSDYFESIEFIPLETTKESLFGKTKWLLITDSSFVVGDKDTWSLLFFDMTGKLLKKHPLPKKVKELSYGMYIEKNSLNNEVIVTNFPTRGGQGEVLTYSCWGKLLSKLKMAFINGKIEKHISLGTDFYATNIIQFLPLHPKQMNSSVEVINIYNKKKTIQKNLLSIHLDNNPFLFSFAGGITMSPQEERDFAIFVIPFDYIFYKLNKDSIRKLGRFIFPAPNVLPERIYRSRNFKSLDSLANLMHLDTKLIETVANINIFKNNIIFKVQKRVTLIPDISGIIYDPLNFMYDTVSKKLISFEKLSPDFSSYYLPIMDGYSSANGMNFHKGYLYASMSSLNMFSAKEKTKLKNPKYPPVLQDYFKTQNRKSNPVIVRMKLKE